MLRHLRPLAAVVALAPAVAGAQTLTPYNVVTLGNYQLTNSDVQGRAAVAGNAQLTNFGIAAAVPPAGYTGYSLVVGGALNATNGQVGPVPGGQSWVGGGATLTNATVPNLRTPPGTPAPVDFAAEGARFRALSDAIAGRAATAVTRDANGFLTFAATGNGINTFRVSVADLQQANRYGVNFGAFGNATFLIDVVGATNGSSLFRNIGVFVDGQQGNGPAPRPGTNRILWNLASAGGVQGTAVLENGAGVTGSLLAPRTNLTSGFAQIVGNVVVNNWNSTTQVYPGGIFVGELPPTAVVPEPATVALVASGLGILGVVARRRRTR